ncbi:MAG: hypothetical protein DCC49_12475 [Acidobacteria bacterium]|nr:MAG: hypothetical protein DCC49_12475 [Acidobacteriota bacterium]
MAARASGVSSLEQVEAVLGNPAIYELAEVIETESELGGRRLTYPTYMLLVYESLISVYRSARRVETEIGHPLVWSFMREVVVARFAHDSEMWLPDEPMRRHHYLYGRDRYLVPNRELLRDLFEKISCRQATGDLSLCAKDGPGSPTHPHPTRMLYADGKVVTPLFKAKPGTTKVDKTTGEVRQVRSEPDAALHVTGSGEPAWGTKHVMVATRGDDVHCRMILSVSPVERPGQEAKVALERIGSLAAKLSGATGVIYDGAFRGAHIAELMHDRGLLPVVPVQAKSGGKRARKARVERSVRIGEASLRRADGTRITVQLYAEAGALCIGELDEAGAVVMTPLQRLKVEQRRNVDGTWRWYGVYSVPAPTGPGTVRVRLDTTDEDRARSFNRCEHLRAIPPSDPDYRRLCPMRSDAESINRHLDDTMWLSRAHSLGRDRQLVNLIGYGLAVNSLALHRYRRNLAPPGALAA